MSRDVTPEVRDAIVKYAAIELLLLFVGVVLYFAFNAIWAPILAAVLAGGVGLFLILQARGSNDR